MEQQQDQQQPPLTNKTLRFWSGVCFVVALALTVAQAFGWAEPDSVVLASLMATGMSGLGLVQYRNVQEHRDLVASMRR